MSSWTPTNYKTKNWSHYNRALKQRGSLSIWFDAEMAWEAKPSGHRGRQQAYSDAAIQACLTMKVLFGLPLRQTTGFVESLLEFIGLDWSVPDFSTLCRRQKTALKLRAKGSGTPASMAVLNAASGARYTLVSMSKHWKYVQSRSRVAVSVTHPYYLICSTRSRQTKK